MITPGQRVRLSRRDLGMTQQELADKSGVSRSYIGNLERDSTTNVGRDVVIKLANGLGVAPDYLLVLTDNPLEGILDEDGENEDKPIKKAGETSATYTVTNPEVELLITIYQLLGSEKRKILLNMAKVLRDAETGHIIGTEPASSPDQDGLAPAT